MEAEQPGIFGPGGAFAQAFALFNCSMAAATLFGPVVAGTLIQNYGWKTLTLAMGIFSFSGAIPSVSSVSIHASLSYNTIFPGRAKFPYQLIML